MGARMGVLAVVGLARLRRDAGGRRDGRAPLEGRRRRERQVDGNNGAWHRHPGLHGRGARQGVLVRRRVVRGGAGRPRRTTPPVRSPSICRQDGRHKRPPDVLRGLRVRELVPDGTRQLGHRPGAGRAGVRGRLRARYRRAAGQPGGQEVIGGAVARGRRRSTATCSSATSRRASSPSTSMGSRSRSRISSRPRRGRWATTTARRIRSRSGPTSAAEAARRTASSTGAVDEVRFNDGTQYPDTTPPAVTQPSPARARTGGCWRTAR